MKIGAMELILIFIVALIVIGPDKMPYYAKKLGETLTQFKKATDAATKDIKESVINPLEEAQKPIREALEPVEELNKAVNGNFKDLTESVNNIGKQKKAIHSAPDKSENEAPAIETEIPVNSNVQDHTDNAAVESGVSQETGIIPDKNCTE